MTAEKRLQIHIEIEKANRDRVARHIADQRRPITAKRLTDDRTSFRKFLKERTA